MTAFLKTTIVGGVLFLLPLAIVLMLLGYALRLASTVAQPISEKLQLQDWGEAGRCRPCHCSLGSGAGLGFVRRRPCRPHLCQAGASRAGSKAPCSADCLNTR